MRCFCVKSALSESAKTVNIIPLLPDEQKAIRVHDFNCRISKTIKYVCESLGIQCVTPQYARNSFISALAHHGVITAYIDYAVGQATSEVSALLAGYISNVTPAMMQAFNEKIFMVQ